MHFFQSLYRFVFPSYGKELNKLNSCEGKKDGKWEHKSFLVFFKKNADIAAGLQCLEFISPLTRHTHF